MMKNDNKHSKVQLSYLVALLLLITSFVVSCTTPGSPESPRSSRPKEVNNLLKKFDSYGKVNLREFGEIEALKIEYEKSQGWFGEYIEIEEKLYQPLALLISDMLAVQLQAMTNNLVRTLSTRKKLKRYYGKKPEHQRDIDIRAERIETVFRYIGYRGHRALKRIKSIEGSMKYCNRLAAIQVGIPRSIDSLARSVSRGSLRGAVTSSRYLVYHDDSEMVTGSDFDTIKDIVFPKLQANNLFNNEFVFQTYAPNVFKNLRLIFGISSEKFLRSFSEDISELSNPGASGMGLFRTNDERYFVKTMQPREGDAMMRMLPRYYMYFLLHPQSMLPRYLGQYAYICANRITRLYVMPNILPKTVKMDEKYDLKGSKYKRAASDKERAKKSPTFKDLDFMDKHPHGFELEPEVYDELINTLSRDSIFLQNFEVMDYSLLLGVHYSSDQGSYSEDSSSDSESDQPNNIMPFKLETLGYKHYWSGIPARTASGQPVRLYFGLIDTLQTFRLKKRMENKFKLVIQGPDISVQDPHYYSRRFIEFMATRVFRRGTGYSSSDSSSLFSDSE